MCAPYNGADGCFEELADTCDGSGPGGRHEGWSSSGGLSTGSIVGIVIAVLAVFAGCGFLALIKFRIRERIATRWSAAHSDRQPLLFGARK